MFLFLCLRVFVAELLRKRRSEAIPLFVIRYSSFFVSAHSGPVLGAIIRTQDGFQHRSTDGPGLIGNRKTIAYLAPGVDIADF